MAGSVRADVLEVTEEQLWPDGGAPHVRDAAVEAVNEGLADLSAGRVMSLDQLKARLARRCAERGRARRKVA